MFCIESVHNYLVMSKRIEEEEKKRKYSTMEVQKAVMAKTIKLKVQPRQAWKLMSQQQQLGTQSDRSPSRMSPVRSVRCIFA